MTKNEETKTEETKMSEVKDSTAAFEEALAKTGDGKYVLRLYVAGMGPKSVQAIDNIKRICEEYLPGKIPARGHRYLSVSDFRQRWSDSGSSHPHKRASSTLEKAHRQHGGYREGSGWNGPEIQG